MIPVNFLTNCLYDGAPIDPKFGKISIVSDSTLKVIEACERCEIETNAPAETDHSGKFKDCFFFYVELFDGHNFIKFS